MFKKKKIQPIRASSANCVCVKRRKSKKRVQRLELLFTSKTKTLGLTVGDKGCSSTPRAGP